MARRARARESKVFLGLLELEKKNEEAFIKILTMGYTAINMRSVSYDL